MIFGEIFSWCQAIEVNPLICANSGYDPSSLDLWRLQQHLRLYYILHLEYNAVILFYQIPFSLI